MTETAARVNLQIPNNATWSDAFTFGDADDTTWDFANKTFHMDVKRSRYDSVALFTLTTGNGRIVVDDTVNRILHFNVADTVFSAVLGVGEYEYDLIMIDASSVRTRIMAGCLRVCQGVTEDP